MLVHCFNISCAFLPDFLMGWDSVTALEEPPFFALVFAVLSGHFKWVVWAWWWVYLFDLLIFAARTSPSPPCNNSSTAIYTWPNIMHKHNIPLANLAFITSWNSQSEVKYSFLHLDVMCCNSSRVLGDDYAHCNLGHGCKLVILPDNKCDGVNGLGSLGSLEMYVQGLSFNKVLPWLSVASVTKCGLSQILSWFVRLTRCSQKPQTMGLWGWISM